ncbi:MAG TPA: hypothetical protein VK527_04250 [Candidatus Limnocylindrales bacterium]|jgi:hypothetical protein|nr:hypothetical protein [Candidatus Limnocylindrales bacterium]
MKRTGFNRERDSGAHAQRRSEEWNQDPIGRMFDDDPIDGPLEEDEEEELEDEEDDDDLDDDDESDDDEEEEEEEEDDL